MPEDEEYMNNYRLLVVEDQEENIEAAKRYFEDHEDVAEVDYATTYEEALDHLQENVYAGAIVDVHFPEKEGGEPEKRGIELSEEHLDVLEGTYRTPHVFHTKGYDHSKEAAIVVNNLLGRGVDRLKNSDSEEERFSGFGDAGTQKGKSSTESWDRAFRVLKGEEDDADDDLLDQIWRAKQRYTRFTGNTEYPEVDASQE